MLTHWMSIEGLPLSCREPRLLQDPPGQAHAAWKGRFHFQIVFSVVLVTVHKSCL